LEVGTGYAQELLGPEDGDQAALQVAYPREAVSENFKHRKLNFREGSSRQLGE